MKFKNLTSQFKNFLKNFFPKIWSWIKRHKFWSVIILLAIIGSVFILNKTLFKKELPSSYEYETIKKEHFVTALTGSGPIVASVQLDVKPKASGDVVAVFVKPGDYVKEGAIIAQVSTTNLDASVRDAKTSLESARDSYRKYSEDNSKDKLTVNLMRSYDTAYSSLSSAYADMDASLEALEGLLQKDSMSYGVVRMNGGEKAANYQKQFEADYYKSQASYKTSVETFRKINKSSNNNLIDSNLSTCYKSLRTFSDTLKNLKDFTDYMYGETNRSAEYAAIRTTVNDLSTKINGDLNSISSAQTAVQDSKKAFTDASYGIKSSASTVKEKENALADAQNKLGDYVVRAPISGVVAKVDAKIGDQVTSASNIATVVSKEKMVKISLNEFDISKTKVGQKVTATFDALPNVTATGTIAEADIIGTQNQGVVTYGVKIVFDGENDQIRPGMTASVSITTDERDNVLLVPNAALKGKRGAKYVEVVPKSLVKTETGIVSPAQMQGIVFDRKNVTIGSAGDLKSEVLDGINEGDAVVVRVVKESVEAAMKKMEGDKNVEQSNSI